MYRLAVALFVIAPLTIGAQTPKGAPPKEPTTEELIAQLGHKSFAVREKAMVLLRQRGPRLLPELKKALAGPDAEVRERLQVLTPELEKIAALTPKKITLDVKQKTILELAVELGKQGGFDVRVNGANSPTRYDFALKDVPFWDAVSQLQNATGYGIANYQYDKQLSFEKVQGATPFVVNHGPVRLELVHLHEDRDVTFNGKGNDGQPFKRYHVLTLRFRAYVEPRYMILDALPFQIDSATDQDHKPYTQVPLVKELRHGNNRWGQLFTFDTELRIQRTADSSTSIRELKGTLPLNLVVEKKPVIVSEDLSKASGTKFRIGNDNLQVTRANVHNTGGEVEMLIPARDGNSNSEHWHNRMILEDDAGLRFRDSGRGTSSSGTEYRVSVFFDVPGGVKIGPPKRFIVEDWITLTYSVPFTFKDIPLP
jgi:hypothetical protein